jgi:hypothetical protein
VTAHLQFAFKAQAAWAVAERLFLITWAEKKSDYLILMETLLWDRYLHPESLGANSG